MQGDDLLHTTNLRLIWRKRSRQHANS